MTIWDSGTYTPKKFEEKKVVATSTASGCEAVTRFPDPRQRTG